MVVFPCHQGKIISQGLDIWVQLIQVEDSWEIQQKQEVQIRCQDSCR